MATPAPDPRDVLDFKFRSIRKIRLQDEAVGLESLKQLGAVPTQRLVVANTLGLVFAGVHNSLLSVNVGDVEAADNVDKETKKTEARANATSITLPSTPTHLGLNADETTLSVFLELKGIPHTYMFDTRSFIGPAANQTKPFMEIPGTTPPGTKVKEIAWNPVVPAMLGVVFTDGSMALYLVASDGSKFDSTTLPPTEQISCISWSPKGKQIVAGRLNGKLTQYKPDLKEAKTMEPPSAALKAVSILWISTYQFLVAYQDLSDPDSRPGLFVAQGSKTGSMTYTNYDDICYSTGDQKQGNFAMVNIAEWGTIFCASSNAIEVGVLGAKDKEQTAWDQWLLPDSGRAELPLMANQDERYPVGMAICTSSQKILPTGEENSTLPFPMPIMFVLSGDGMLCGFYAINQMSNATNVTTPPNPKASSTPIRPGKVILPAAPAAPLAPLPAFGGGGGIQPKPVAPAAPAFQDPSRSFIASTPIKAVPEDSKKQVTQPTPAFSLVAPTGAGSFAAPIGGRPQTSLFPPTASAPPQAPALLPTPAPQPPPVTLTTKDKELPKLSVPTNIGIPKAAPPASKNDEAGKEDEAQITGESYRNAIVEEILSFEKELGLMRQKAASLRVNIGTEEEKTALKVDCHEMEKFCKDLVEITASQNQEVHDLQQATIESFEWAEEAKSRDVRNKDPFYQRLLKGRALDPLSQKRLANVQSKYLYLEQQMEEANTKLDMEWEAHLEKSKVVNSRLRRLEAPSRETIYRALLNNSHIIETQKSTVDKLISSVKELKMQNSIPWAAAKSSVSEKEVDSLAASLLEKTQLAGQHHQNGGSPKSTTALHSFSPEKEGALRRHLVNKGINRVKPDPSLSIVSKPKNVAASKSLLKSLDASKTPTFTKPRLSKPPTTTTMASPSFGGSSVAPPTKPVAAFSGFGTAGASTSLATPLTLTSKAPALPPPSYAASSSVSLGLAKPQATMASSSFTGFGTSTPSSLPTMPGIAKPVSVSTTLATQKPSLNLSSGPSGFSFTTTSTTQKPVTTTAAAAPTAAPAAPILTSLLKTPSTTPVAGAGDTAAAPKTGFTFASLTPAEAASKPLATSTSAPIGFGTGSTTLSFGSSTAISTASTTATKPVPAVASSTGFSFSSSTTPPSTTSIAATSLIPKSTASSSVTAKTSVTTTTTTSMATATTTVTTTSDFGASKSSAPTSSVFGSEGLSTTKSSSIFGGTPAASASSSIFGSKPATTTTSTSATTAATTTTSSSSVFGGSSSLPSKPASIFGGATTAVTASSVTPTASTSTSTAPTSSSTTSSLFAGSSTLFGGSATETKTASGTTSFFGGTPAAGGTGSIFGGSSAQASTGKSVFGSSTPAAASTASTGSVFGASSVASPTLTTAAAATQPSASGSTTSVFGGSAKPLFGGQPSEGGGSSIFGGGAASATTSATSASVFGGKSTTTNSSSVFGGASSAAATGASPFGGAGGPTSTVSSSVFGGGFGATTASTTSAASSTTSSPFGGSSVFGGAPAASSSSSTTPASTVTLASTTSSIFGGQPSSGGFFSGLGAAPSAANANKNVFGGTGSGGTPSAFGATPSNTAENKSLFGGSTSVFGAASSTPASTASGFGFASTGGSVASKGFGVAPATPTSATSAQSKPGAFGSAPVFGGSPSAFGGAPVFGSGASPTQAPGGGGGFGSPPSFGGSPAFGSAGAAVASPTSMFGGGAAANAPTFGSMAQQPSGGSTFGSIATQGSTGFGSPAGGGFGGGGAPAFGGGGGGGSSTSSGGASFSSWR